MHRLVRTGPLIDWFDVEALEVTGMDAKIEDEVFILLTSLSFWFLWSCIA